MVNLAQGSSGGGGRSVRAIREWPHAFDLRCVVRERCQHVASASSVIRDGGNRVQRRRLPIAMGDGGRSCRAAGRSNRRRASTARPEVGPMTWAHYSGPAATPMAESRPTDRRRDEADEHSATATVMAQARRPSHLGRCRAEKGNSVTVRAGNTMS